MPHTTGKTTGKQLFKLFGNNSDPSPDKDDDVDDDALIRKSPVKLLDDYNKYDKMPISGFQLPYKNAYEVFGEKGTTRVNLVPQVRYFKYTSEVDNQVYHVFDASQYDLIQMSSRISRIMTGTHRRDAHPYEYKGDVCIVINSSRARVTYEYFTKMFKLWHSQWPGGLKIVSIKRILENTPNRLVESEVHRRLPKNSMRNTRMHQYLKVFPFELHDMDHLNIPQIVAKTPPPDNLQLVHKINTQKKSMLFDLCKTQLRNEGELYINHKNRINKEKELVSNSNSNENEHENEHENEYEKEVDTIKLMDTYYSKLDPENYDATIPKYQQILLYETDLPTLKNYWQRLRRWGYNLDLTELEKQYTLLLKDKYYYVRLRDYAFKIREFVDDGKVQIEQADRLYFEHERCMKLVSEYLAKDSATVDEHVLELQYELKLLKDRNYEEDMPYIYDYRYHQTVMQIKNSTGDQGLYKDQVEHFGCSKTELLKIRQQKNKWYKSLKNKKQKDELFMNYYWKKDMQKDRQQYYKYFKVRTGSYV